MTRGRDEGGEAREELCRCHDAVGLTFARWHAQAVGDVAIGEQRQAFETQWRSCAVAEEAFAAVAIVGSDGDEPKVACPLHKKPFSLKTGASLSGEDYSVKVFPVKVVDGEVLVELPPTEQLDALLSTKMHCISSCDAQKAHEMECATV